MIAPRTVLAPNASPLTLDGTRTYLVGRETVAVIDPGPDLPVHLEAIATAVQAAGSVAIMLTHQHPDHAAGAPALARRLAAPGRTVHGPAVPAGGELVRTDEGELCAIPTPGHTPDHCAIHWPAGSAIFCGDLMMGGLDTALVAAPDGNLAAYLDSLERLADLAPAVVYPAHGPHFTDPAGAFRRYREHRVQRLHVVQHALESGSRSVRDITAALYGPNVEPELQPWLEAATMAYLEYLTANRPAEPGGWHHD